VLPNAGMFLHGHSAVDKGRDIGVASQCTAHTAQSSMQIEIDRCAHQIDRCAHQETALTGGLLRLLGILRARNGQRPLADAPVDGHLRHQPQTLLRRYGWHAHSSSIHIYYLFCIEE